MKAKLIIGFILLISIDIIGQSVLVKTGIEMLEMQNFEILVDKRVGLITNATGVNSKLKSTIDILYDARNVNLVAIFGPEHGVRGNTAAGDIDDNIDERTGLPIFSLYGNTKKPTAKMLKGIDVLVYDIQDVGVRSYTYISTMGLAMEAAAENKKEFIVLDRPNPLGNRIEGPLVEDGYFSFVSKYPIPYIYGLTAGELATFLNDEKLLKDGRKCKLSVVEMEGWTRNMVFHDTGLPWVPTSPHVPVSNTPFFYSLSGIIGELDPNMVGIGYTLPFQVLAMPWLNADSIAIAMTAFNMPGVAFRPIRFKPFYMKRRGVDHEGVQVYITDYNKVNLTQIQFRFIEVAYKQHPEHPLFQMRKSRNSMFDRVVGSGEIRKKFSKRYRYDDIKVAWERPASIFKENVGKYYLYN
ncbi:MAG: DUF1343 domain-containing protein [Ichthyobacteriaceae bacterium]|nr:DUF1343 domain-containing protein [Ichthyobacteriaceae bacterium]